ncbi:adenosylcobinamide-GDP ribazoletransferase [Cypionkella sp.]|uniref:adenosylcobinamide-GDP ribazoletransferase n=1 Tax=Cypionkella sp. TaxID=2811411 RepID=UPI002627D718|nr:adenosylcobinamide-GDP ribazoletransferase [Cypionkella sp.]MDB5664282.1 cobalamin 5-phosphate synthase [Cypionkella sp.]
MTPLRTRLTEVQLAVMLLTRLPAGQMLEAPAICAAVWAFPIAGALVGSISAAILYGAMAAGIAPALAAGLALATGILTTGGLHEDGLADVADGFGGGHNRARKLEIMRDSRIGSYGGLALILSLGLRWQAITLLAVQIPNLAMIALIALAISSRAGLGFALLWMPAARADGMGKSAAGTSLICAVSGLLIAAVALAILLGPQTALYLLLAQIAVQLAFARIALRQIGGQSGDVLGAMQQLAEIAGWLVLAR